MKVLVTGGCGYQGAILVPKLIKNRHEVVVVDTLWFGNYLESNERLTVVKADIREQCDDLYKNIDVIIHLASVANDVCAELNPSLSWEIGPLASLFLAEKAKQYGINQFIYASSSSVYGVSEQEKVTEELPLKPISDYNKSKMVTERVLMSYADDFSLTIIRPATVCGYSPRMRLDLSVNMLTMQALSNNRITVFGGAQERPNIHIDDLTDVYLFFLSNPHLKGVYNAGFENLSILEIATMVQQKVPSDIVVTESNDPRSYRVCSDKLTALGYKPKKGVINAINELIKYHQDGVLKDAQDAHNINVMRAMKL